MLYSEFHNLTGIRCTTKVYDNIQEIYYNAIDMNKQTFCSHYKRIHANPLLKIVFDKWKEYEQRYIAAAKDVKMSHQTIKKVFDTNNELKAQVFLLKRELNELSKKYSTSKK